MGGCQTMTPGAGGETTKVFPTLRKRHDCGDFPMRIARDGSWHYKGSPINRKELVCLFASVLKRDPDGSFVLETPVERGRIAVDDAPFVAVELVWRHCCCDGGGPKRQCLSFRTNLDEVVTAGENHPIRVAIDHETREPRPYITVRPGLEARIGRPVFYEMVALAEEEEIDGRPMIGVWSEGVFFPIDDAPTGLDDGDEDDADDDDDDGSDAPHRGTADHGAAEQNAAGHGARDARA